VVNSLTVLNVSQATVMSLGLAAMALMAGLEAVAGRMGPGDVTAAVLILLNLYGPLNILGFAYREIRQSFIDMEAMLDLRRQAPDVAEAPDARDLPRRRRTGRGGGVQGRLLPPRRAVGGHRRCQLHRRAGHDRRAGGAVGGGKDHPGTAGPALIDPQAARSPSTVSTCAR